MYKCADTEMTFEDEVTFMLRDTNDYDVKVVAAGDNRWTVRTQRDMALEDAEWAAYEIVNDLVERLDPQTCEGIEIVSRWFVEGGGARIELEIKPGGDDRFDEAAAERWLSSE